MKLTISIACMLVIVLALYLHKRGTFKKLFKHSGTSGKHKVYGSMGCPYTVKQLEHLDANDTPYDFVDCDTMGCPAEVDGYPTTILFPSGETVSGFSDKI